MEREALRAIQEPLKERYREEPAAALVACAGVTLRAVATSLGISVESGQVRAEGDLDFRGTLAVDRDAPVASRRSGSPSISTPTPTPSSSTRC